MPPVGCPANARHLFLQWFSGSLANQLIEMRGYYKVLDGVERSNELDPPMFNSDAISLSWLQCFTRQSQNKNRKPIMLCFYLTPQQGDFNQIPELQVCIAEALYDVVSPPK